MDVSNSALRRQSILEALDRCDSRDSRESLLLDKILELQNTLFELQDSYCSLLLFVKRLNSTELDVYFSTNYKK